LGFIPEAHAARGEAPVSVRPPAPHHLKNRSYLNSRRKIPITTRLLNIQDKDQDRAMTSKVAAGTRTKKVISDNRYQVKAVAYPGGGVSESTLPVRGQDRRVEQLLADIVTRLERIEEKIDENVYPPESAIKPAFVARVKKARTDIKKGNRKTYESMDAFIRAISE
jgi:hypothetical protein